MSETPKYKISPKFICEFYFCSAILSLQIFYFSILNPRNHRQKWQEPLKKVSSDSSKFSMYLHFCPPYWVRHLLFSNCKLLSQILNQWRQKFLSSNVIIQHLVTICIFSAILEPPFFVFIYFQFKFVISISKKPQLLDIIRSKERCTSMCQRDIKHHKSTHKYKYSSVMVSMGSKPSDSQKNRKYVICNSSSSFLYYSL